MHKTSAWPLAITYAALIVFASLFPFEGWRTQEVEPWMFVVARLPPQYWTGFDVASNLVGYMPMGFLLALALLRTGQRAWRAFAIAVVVGALLSLLMEFLQIYLPRRVPSNLDWLLNSAGTLLGALAAALLERWGALHRWSVLRERWLVPEAHGALVLLVMWPLAQLFPAAVPFGLGQVLERLAAWGEDMLEGTALLDALPLREGLLEPLSPGGEALCVLLGLLIPCMLACSIVRSAVRRVMVAGVLMAAGVLLTALSAALSWGPVHAWDWMSVPVQVGLVAALIFMLPLLAVPRRTCAALLLPAVVWHLALLNQAPTSAYFAQTLQEWEQGRFIHFYGLGQWLGWLWPFAALGYALLTVSRRERTSTMAA